MFYTTVFEEDTQQASDFILWRTRQPIKVVIGEKQVFLVAKGSCILSMPENESKQSTNIQPSINACLSEVLNKHAKSAASYADIEKNIDRIADDVKDRLQREVKAFGINIAKFKIHIIGGNE